MEKFKEKKIVKVFDSIVVVCAITLLLSLMFSLVNERCLIGFLVLPFGLVFTILSGILSKKNKYTDKFIEYIRRRLLEAVTIDDHLSILEEFKRLAMENNHYVLSYTESLRRLHEEIKTSILVLQKQNK